jgi:hypothetical protein
LNFPIRPADASSESENEVEMDDARDNYVRYTEEIRTTILNHGYRDALMAWTRSVPLRMMTPENQEESFRFFLWTRNLFILFERYGAVQSRGVLDLMDPDLIRAEHWSQAEAYEAWLQHRNATDSSDDLRQTLRGWTSLTRTELERGRPLRARLHSLDAVSDVLYEPTEAEAEFIAVLGEAKYQTEDGLQGEHPQVGDSSTVPTAEETDIVPEPVTEVDAVASVEDESTEL